MMILYIFILAIVLPLEQLLVFRRQIPNFKANPKLKEREYLKTFIQLWLLLFAALYLIHDLQWSYAHIGLSLSMDLSWTLIFSALLLFLIVMIFSLKIDASNVDKVQENYKDIMFFMPTNTYQYRWTILLSISAGITEEIIFRGFLFVYFEEFLGWIAALIISNLIFALNHIWSGLKNLGSSFILGLIFSATFLLTESLILATVLHIIVDIYSMRTVKLLTDYLNKNAELT